MKFIYVPFKGGGEVCVNLVGNHVDSTVNNPIECASHWKAGRVRPLAVFDTARIAAPEWKDVPTVKEALGADISYLMLRGIFGAPDMPKDARRLVPGLPPEGVRHAGVQGIPRPGRAQARLGDRPRAREVAGQAEQLHKDLMTKGGLLKK